MSEWFKILLGGQVVGVGHMYLKYFPRVGRYGYCELREAEVVEDAVSGALYRVDWLQGPPDEAYPPTLADEIRYIDIVEYDELYEELNGGETVPVDPEPEPEPEPEPDPEPDPERPMTVQEMREAISMLTECVLEMSEVVYGE